MQLLKKLCWNVKKNNRNIFTTAKFDLYKKYKTIKVFVKNHERFFRDAPCILYITEKRGNEDPRERERDWERTSHECILLILIVHFAAGTRLGDRSGRAGGANRRVDRGDCYKQSIESVRLRVQSRPYTWHSRHRRSLLRTHYSRWDLRAHGTCPNITLPPHNYQVTNRFICGLRNKARARPFVFPRGMRN